MTAKTHDIRAAFCLDIVADAASATRARREFAGWLGIDVHPARAGDVVLAVYEALANAAEHAYCDHRRPGRMWVTAHRSPGHVRITVADRGRWRTVNAYGEAGYRRRGMQLIRALMDNVHVRTDQHGTLVWLRTPVDRRRGRGCSAWEA